MTVPVGAGNPAIPVTLAVKVKSCPEAGALGNELTTIDGVAVPKLTVIVEDVAGR